VALEDEKEEPGSSMKENKVMGQGTCVGYREEELGEVLEGFKDVLCLKPGKTRIAEMAI